MGFKPKFRRQEIIEEEVPEEKFTEEVDDEEEEYVDEVPVPKPEPIRKQIITKPIVKQEPQPEWSIQEVTSETQPLIYNSKTKKYYTLLSAIAELLNRTE